MNAKSEQKRQTHEGILESAKQLIRERGISGTRVADVMLGAGLTVGGFYAHFKTKEELVDEALRRGAAEVRAMLFSGLEAKPAASRAVVVLKRYLSKDHRDAASIRCPFPAVVGEIASGETAHRPVLVESVEAIVGELATLLPESIETSQRRSMALAFFALMFGGLTLSRALGSSSLSDELLASCRALGAKALAQNK